MKPMFLNDVATAARQLRHLGAGQTELRRAHQLHCVVLVGRGHSCSEVAHWFGDSARSVERWVGAWNGAAASSSARLPHPGRPPKLTDAMRLELVCDLAQPPACAGHDGQKWTGKLLAHHVRLRFGVALGVRQCQRLCLQCRAPGAAAMPGAKQAQQTKKRAAQAAGDASDF